MMTLFWRTPRKRKGSLRSLWVTLEKWITDTGQGDGQHDCVESGGSLANSSRTRNLAMKQMTGLST